MEFALNLLNLSFASQMYIEFISYLFILFLCHSLFTAKPSRMTFSKYNSVYFIDDPSVRKKNGKDVT